MSNFRRRLMMSIKKTKLPDSYTELEYIEGTGTQYIMTNYCPNENTKVIANLCYTGVTDAFIYGARNTYSNSAFGLHRNYAPFSNNPCPNFNGGKYLFGELVIVEQSSNGVFINGNNVYNYVTPKNFTSPYEMCIFSLMQSGGLYKNLKAFGKIGEFIIYNSNDLVFKGIPALDQNGKPCMYDTVSKKAFYNQGTGEFLYR